MPVHLESWVKQQYYEIGFGLDGTALFIGKTALKQKLISRYPMHKTKIRQLVNAIKVPNAQPLAISTPAEEITQYQATPVLSGSPSNPKVESKYPLRLQKKHAPLTIDSTLSPANRLGLDSGFSSGLEDAEQSMSRETTWGGITPTINQKIDSPRSENGGATLGTVRQTTWRSTMKEKALEKPEAIAQSSLHPKLLELKKFLDEAEGLDLDCTLNGTTRDASSISEIQLQLLHLNSETENDREESSVSSIKNAVLFSRGILESPNKTDLPQYGLLGSSDLTSTTAVHDSRLFLNTNIPFSAFVCGVQGSGKSHTTACMLENCLIPSPLLGRLQRPLSALVFNFAEYSSVSSFRPSELAFLASPNPQLPNHPGAKKVNVLVSPSNYLSLKALYTQIPGVTVQPFMLRPQDLNISTMLTLMSVDQTQAAPLYMGTVTKILRNMASETVEGFNYIEFRRRLDDAGLDRKQEEFLNQRLDLLESFLDLDGSTTSPEFAAGEMTIIDLSCPFMDASTACVLFKVGMGLYLESDPRVGKVIVLDEAHKYMTDTPASKALTDSLMGMIRQQRHYGARVIISTQEPSISPKLIDLCSITVMHRFSSPEWLDVLRRHILVSDEDGDRGNRLGLLREIMRLRTGEALVFAPSAICEARDDAGGRTMGVGDLIRMRMRKRVTWDGGRSVICI